MDKNFEQKAFLGILPARIRDALSQTDDFDSLYEVVLDIGRKPEARYKNRSVFLTDDPITFFDLESVISRISSFDRDNRAGIERTLHRISGIMNRQGRPIGLTCRYGRAIEGVIDAVSDIFNKGDSVLLLGRPGVGKTTLLREVARVLADSGKRVIVVDTSNEIAGDGDIPHSGIGGARRMQVPIDVEQHKVMIQAVENHMPEVVVIDEIGTEEEAIACRTIAERGVQLIGTAHGHSLPNLLMNPTLSDLLGGVNSVILSDEEAYRRSSQKTVLERTAPPTFDTLIEIADRGKFVIYENIADTVDEYLRFDRLKPEKRTQNSDGTVKKTGPEAVERATEERTVEYGIINKENAVKIKPVNIYSFGVSRDSFRRAIHSFHINADVCSILAEADMVLTTRTYEQKKPKQIMKANALEIPVYTIPKNTLSNVKRIIKGIKRNRVQEEINETVLQEAVESVLRENKSVRLPPASSNVRRYQHGYAERFGLITSSIGRDPDRSVVIHPPDISGFETEFDK